MWWKILLTMTAGGALGYAWSYAVRCRGGG